MRELQQEWSRGYHLLCCAACPVQQRIAAGAPLAHLAVPPSFPHRFLCSLLHLVATLCRSNIRVFNISSDVSGLYSSRGYFYIDNKIIASKFDRLLVLLMIYTLVQCIYRLQKELC